MRLTLLLILLTPAFAADPPWAGKWKTNLEKSDFGQTTTTFQTLPGGEWQSTGFGITYKFKMDGKEYPDTLGGTVSWKALDASTWEMTAKANGKVTETHTFRLSPDGKTLTDSAKQMKPGGGALETSAVFNRVSGGPGLAGAWKTRKVSGAAGVMELVPSPGGVVFKDVEMGMTCDAKLDGKDYPCAGPLLPPGFTVAVTTAPRGLDMNVKKDGKPFFKAVFTVSADGKSMTEVGAPNAAEKFTVFLDRM